MGGRVSRVPCLMLSCRGREKFPTIMALGAAGGGGGGGDWSSGDRGVGVGVIEGEVVVTELGTLGKGIGMSEGGRESSVELDVRPGAIVLGSTNGCEERPAKRGADEEEEEGERKRDLAAKVLCVGEIGLVGAVENPADAIEVWTDETGTETVILDEPE